MLSALSWRERGLGLALCLLLLISARAAVPRDYSVELSATVSASPPRITLQWPARSANSYSVFRKQKHERGWTHLGDVSGSASSFADSNVAVGSAFEYQVRKNTSENYSGYGFTFAGINVPAIESRGKVLVLVDNRFAGSLSAELTRFLRDLAGDGWIPIRRDVSIASSVTAIKDIIRAEYNADRTNLRSVILFGAIPVPYSGDIAPDDHDNHRGAWPADVFYAEMDGNWSDRFVRSTTAERTINHNVPGDGKFDQGAIPSDVDLEIGRIDLSNLTCFSNKNPARSELDLLRQYLNKDHRFRHKLFTVQRRGIICDYFGFRLGDPIVGSGWRNMTAVLGAGQVTQVPEWTWLSSVTSGSYLMSWAAGGGSYHYSAGVATADELALNDIQAVFTMFLGSYYGDWNNESNFLRAAIGSTSHTLTSAYTGYPHHFLHHMALGETVGYGIRLSQNHDGTVYAVTNRAERQIHIALHGDPTLRAHPVAPPSNFTGSGTTSGVQLRWNASNDTDLAGYNVYRGTAELGPFTKITASPVSATSFTDSAPQGRFVYKVRALKLERSGSGTYYNLSQGAFLTVDSLGGSAPANTEIRLSNLAYSNGTVTFRISGSAGQAVAIEASSDARTWSGIGNGTLSGGTLDFSDSNARQHARRFYRVRKQ